MIDSRIHLYSEKEERINTYTHFLGALLAVIALILMILKVIDKEPIVIFAMIVYALSNICVYTFSTIYHGTKNIEHKIIWQKIDHSMVSIVVAGTAVPALLIVASGTVASIMLCLVLTFTAANIVLNLISVKKFKKYSLILFVLAIAFIMIGVFADSKLESVGFNSFMLLGLFVLSIGGVCYMFKSKDYTHSVWHVSDIICSGFHFLAFYLYAI